MTLSFGKTLTIVLAASIAGCASTNRHGTMTVAYDRSYGTTPYDGSYTTPAFDRSMVVTEAPESDYRLTTTQGTVRTVAMTDRSIRYDITVNDIRNHMRNQSAVMVDARDPKDFNKGHVRGAINIPVGDEDAYMRTFRQQVAPDQLVIVYCGGPNCPASDNVATYLNTQGFSNLRVYKPGWKELSRNELP